MPLYTYLCGACGQYGTAFRTIASRNDGPICTCGVGVKMEKVLDAPAVRGDYEGYTCPVTGKWVEGRRAHEENLKRQGCRVYESGETQEFIKRKAREDEAFENKIADTAEAVFETMPSEKKERLAAELAAGATATVVRSTPNAG